MIGLAAWDTALDENQGPWKRVILLKCSLLEYSAVASRRPTLLTNKITCSYSSKTEPASVNPNHGYVCWPKFRCDCQWYVIVVAFALLWSLSMSSVQPCPCFAMPGQLMVFVALRTTVDKEPCQVLCKSRSMITDCRAVCNTIQSRNRSPFLALLIGVHLPHFGVLALFEFLLIGELR